MSLDLQTDITNTLNHNGHDEVQITNVDESLTGGKKATEE